MGISVSAQTDYKQQYFNGKNLFREGKYNLAMETFKPLVSYDANNPFSEYASFYYALSAYNQGYLAVAKDMFNQIKKLYPNWNKMDEVNLWLGVIYMENHEYFQGLKIWSGIKNPMIQDNIKNLKLKYLAFVQDAETLRMMNEDYAGDKQIAKLWGKELAKNLSDKENRIQFEALIKRYGFDRGEFINEAPPTYFKDIYTVAAIYPFMLSSLEPSPGKKRNQIILDLYEGMKLAVDTLETEGIKISLRAYDTEHKVTAIRRILETEELKNTDLIVGPFFSEENKLVQDFSMEHRINLFKPFTNNLEMIGGNEFGFLMQPAYETIGRKSAEFLADNVKRKKTCMVFSGVGKKDSILVKSFLQTAREKGLDVVSVQMLPKDATGSIVDVLATPTEFDEWKVPTQFTLKKDSLGSIYVASDDALIYSKVISSVEQRKDSIVVLGSESWLEQNALDYEKLQSLGIVLSSPNFTSASNPYYKAFVKKYIGTCGQFPSSSAKLGYELMMFLGHSLHKYGVYFQEAFIKEAILPGYLSQGFSYQFNHDNQLIPFVGIKRGELVLIANK